MNCRKLVNRFLVEEEGADATEYALVLGLIALAIVGGAAALGGGLSSAFNAISGRVNCATGPGANATC